MVIITEEQLNKCEKGLPKRLTINGMPGEYASYKIPLSLLYYNDMNGRISTYIDEYDENHKNMPLKELLKSDKEKYNDIIADFIKESSSDNLASFNKTKEDIRAKGQQQPGVILSDGRIIDGNRRFTALRELFRETGDLRFAFFEAVCLSAPQENDKAAWLAIKLLELNLQFDVDEKKGYNRIDFLVSFYKDVMNPLTKLCDEKTYCHASGMKASEFKTNTAVVETMLDYLDWRGKPKAFHILKNEKLDGPIEDIAKKRTKMSEEEWNEKKFYIYSAMTIDQTGDRTRKTRELLNSAVKEGALYHVFKEAVDTPAVRNEILKVVSKIDHQATTPEESAQMERDKNVLENTLNKAYLDGVFKQQIEKEANGPAKAMENVLKALNAIELSTVQNLENSEKEELLSRIEAAENKIQEIKDVTK